MRVEPHDNGIRAPRGDRGELVSSLALLHVRTQQKGGHPSGNQEEELSPEPNNAGTLISESQLQTVRNKGLLPKAASLWYSVTTAPAD